MAGSLRCQSCGEYIDPEAGDEVVELRTTGTAGPAISGGPLCRSCYTEAVTEPSFSIVGVFKIGSKRVAYMPDSGYFSTEQCRYAPDPLQGAED